MKKAVIVAFAGIFVFICAVQAQAELRIIRKGDSQVTRTQQNVSRYVAPAQPVVQSARPAFVPVSAYASPRRFTLDKSRDRGRVVSGKKIPPPPIVAVPYHLEKGEVIDRDVNRYTEKNATKDILRATRKTPAQAKKLKVGEAVLIPEKKLKEEYRDPLKKIDQLRAEKQQLEALIAEMEQVGAVKDEVIVSLRNRVSELNTYIANYIKGSVEYVEAKTPAPAPVTPAAPAVPVNPPAQQPVPPVTNPVPATPAVPVNPPAMHPVPAPPQATPPAQAPPTSSIPVIGGGTENVAKKATTSDDWSDVLANDFGIGAKAGSKLAKNK